MRARPYLAAIAAAGSMAGCGATDATGAPPPIAACPPSTTVAVLDVGFVPPCVTIPLGAAVRFQNLDTVDHTVTGYTERGGSFDSRLLAPGQEFSHTFVTGPETVQLRCSLHPSTVGKVVVE